MKRLSLNDLNGAIVKLKEKAVKPGIVQSKKQAKLMVQADALIGIKSKWKKGDEFYEMKMHTDTQKKLFGI